MRLERARHFLAITISIVCIVYLLSACDGNPTFHNSMGNSYYKKGKLDQAIAKYQKALEIDPNFVAAHNDLGMVYFKQGNLDQAIAKYQKALQIDPNLAQAHNNLGLVL